MLAALLKKHSERNPRNFMRDQRANRNRRIRKFLSFRGLPPSLEIQKCIACAILATLLPRASIPTAAPSGTWTALFAPGGGDIMIKIGQYFIFSAVMDISES